VVKKTTMANEEKRREQGVEIESEEPERAEATENAAEGQPEAPGAATEPKEAAESAEEEVNAGPEPEPEDEEERKESSQEEESERYMRLMADFQNYKRRVEKEKSETFAYANEKLVTQLLEVLDNFERALEHEAADEGFGEGMNMIFKQLTDVLSKSGLEEIKALGEDFDPNFHNAVMTTDDSNYESGKVTNVMQKGYTLNGKVIRPSMVMVNN
jgi:molecular chaperone GrpE